MFQITRSSYLSLSSFLLGISIGCLVLTYLLITTDRMMYVPSMIASAVSATPFCMAVLAISLFRKPLQPFIAPLLALGGFTLPCNFAFACMLGLIDDLVLKGAVGILFAVAMSLFSLLTLTFRRRSRTPGSEIKHSASSLTLKHATGAAQ